MDRRVTPEAASKAVLAAISEHASSIARLDALAPTIVEVATLISRSLESGGKVLICGNGGSAADAQHIAGEFVGRFLKERRPLPALALHANTSILTAVGNDYGFDEVFARQVAALGKRGDVLIGISTSGNSPNVLRAVERAREIGMTTVGLAGVSGGMLKNACDLCICVPSGSTPRIQEMHILVGHIICQLVEEAVC